MPCLYNKVCNHPMQSTNLEIEVRFLQIDAANPEAPERDRFLMSKGHACVPFYACLERQGFLPSAMLRKYGEEVLELLRS